MTIIMNLGQSQIITIITAKEIKIIISGKITIIKIHGIIIIMTIISLKEMITKTIINTKTTKIKINIPIPLFNLFFFIITSFLSQNIISYFSAPLHPVNMKNTSPAIRQAIIAFDKKLKKSVIILIVVGVLL